MFYLKLLGFLAHSDILSDVLLLSKVRFSVKFEHFQWIGLKCTAVWLAQRVNRPQMYIHLRPIWYIWGRVNLFCHVMCLSQSDSSDSCTFERKSASNVQKIGLKCMESASNVQLSDWLRQNWPQMYSCLIGSDRKSASNVQLSVHLRPILAKLIDR